MGAIEGNGSGGVNYKTGGGDYAEFQPLDQGAQVDLDFAANTRYPPKSLFLPQSETMRYLAPGQRFRKSTAPSSKAKTRAW